MNSVLIPPKPDYPFPGVLVARYYNMAPKNTWASINTMYAERRNKKGNYRGKIKTQKARNYQRNWGFIFHVTDFDELVTDFDRVRKWPVYEPMPTYRLDITFVLTPQNWRSKNGNLKMFDVDNYIKPIQDSFFEHLKFKYQPLGITDDSRVVKVSAEKYCKPGIPKDYICLRVWLCDPRNPN